jgi:catechol 2,3-dioxygenase-like lactoylglutathione lyase family enzyme
MFSGTHITLFSHDAEADRAFFRDVLRLPAVDAGGGWLIFALPRAELGVHPAEADGPAGTEFYFMTEDVAGLIAELAGRNVAADAVTDAGWGLLTHIALPGGGRLGIYQPRHARPPAD